MTIPADLPGDIELRVSREQVPYRAALDEMTTRNAAVAAGEARELIWLLEHPPVYTAGTSAAAAELLVGASWVRLDKGDFGGALRSASQAVRFQPLKRNTTVNLGAITVKSLRRAIDACTVATAS
jgi:lipoate-protein ligase B